MNEFDNYCNDLLEEAKHFLEIAKDNNKQDKDYTPFLRASLLIAFSSLEAFVFGIADDFRESNALNIYEKGFLDEKDINFKNGMFSISDRLKMTRLIERIEFLLVKFKSNNFDKNDPWWSQLSDGIKKRNGIVHPRDNEILTTENVSQFLSAIITCINLLFKAVYKRALPASKLGLVSKKDF